LSFPAFRCGVVSSTVNLITAPRGGTVTLSIPYDTYTPQELVINGTTYPLAKANGLATATITLPEAGSTAGTLT